MRKELFVSKSRLQRLFEDIDREEVEQPIIVFSRTLKDKKVNLIKKK